MAIRCGAPDRALSTYSDRHWEAFGSKKHADGSTWGTLLSLSWDFSFPFYQNRKGIEARRTVKWLLP